MTRIWRALLLWVGLCVAAPAAAGGFDIRHERIPGWDGTGLGAVVMVPEGQGAGPFPLVVMPSSWGLPSLEYVGRGRLLAERGYVVVSYTSRGFWDSAGEIDIAGAATVEDVSAVIDWALANTPADPARIGASGISYGAGSSLLAAARDPRIRAVAALSGWADLEASLYANRTFSAQGGQLLVIAGALTGRPGPELAAATRHILAGRYEEAVQGLLPGIPQRNPASELAALNASRPAILLGNAYSDGLFPPGQIVDFFRALAGPKQLLLVHGDHATTELPGALGLPNVVYDAVGRWFDRHLRGDVGAETGPAVRLRSQTGDWAEFADWDAVEAGAVAYHLSRPAGLWPTGALRPAPSGAWTHRIRTGVPTLAHSGVILVSGFMQGLQLPPSAWLPAVSRSAAAVWAGPIEWRERRVVGMPRLQLTATPEQAQTTLYAYLYSADALGNGELIAHKPYSLSDALPGQAQQIELRLEATHWKLPPGRRLALVVDTVDLRYAGLSAWGGGLSLTSPATLWVPMQ